MILLILFKKKRRLSLTFFIKKSNDIATIQTFNKNSLGGGDRTSPSYAGGSNVIASFIDQTAGNIYRNMQW